jgi:hypothetical protein
VGGPGLSRPHLRPKGRTPKPMLSLNGPRTHPSASSVKTAAGIGAAASRGRFHAAMRAGVCARFPPCRVTSPRVQLRSSHRTLERPQTARGPRPSCTPGRRVRSSTLTHRCNDPGRDSLAICADGY